MPALAAVAVAVAMALPAAGAAASSALSDSSTEPIALTLPASINESIHLRGSHGYRIELGLFDHSRVIVRAERGSVRGGEQSILYFGKVPRNHGTDFVARLGDLGRVDVRFRRESTVLLPTEGECVGEGTTLERGRFVGTIVFRGERGYTDVKVGGARGEVSREAARTCGDSRRQGAAPDATWAATDRTEPPGRSFALVAHNRTRRVIFEAGRFEGFGLGDSTYFVATHHGRAGNLHLVSTASIYLRSGRQFRLTDSSRPLSGAVLAPGGPFSGTATFSRESPTRASWEGDLAVELPGLGEVPLTGSQASPATLCSGRTCVGPQGGGSG
jgi:hypothetical protein